MTWIDRVRERARLAVMNEADLRATAKIRLVEAYQLALEAPPDVLIAYIRESDKTVDEIARPIEERLSKGRLSFNLQDGAKDLDALLLLGAVIRALDNYLEGGQTERGPVARAGKKWLVAADPPAYLIPTTVPRKGFNAEDKDGFGAFTLRALRHHRIIPAKVHDYDVLISEAGLTLGRQDGDLRLGAGLFTDLDITPEDSSPQAPFVAKEVVCETLDEELGSHLVNAHESRCAILSLPELTIDLQRRVRIAADLAFKPWSIEEGEEAWHVPIVLAGSWHERDGDEVYNVAPLYDAYGRELVKHRKVFPYVPKEGQVEGIVSGGALTVLVTDDALLAIGICRDFCERGGVKPNPYSLLDVDLFVVTSMGNATTMKGHFATAQDVGVRFRAGAFVVQQAHPKEKDVCGFVLTPDDQAEGDPKSMGRTGSWVGPKNSTPKG